jgi:copper ion binding protein
MRISVSSLLAACAALTLTLNVAAEEAICPAAKTEATSASAQCSASQACSASQQCDASKTQTVMLKLRNARDDAKLAKALAKLEGVSAVQTCSESKFTKVSYSGDKVCADKIMAALKDAGYKIKARRVSYAVEDLACGSCSEKLSTALNKVKGVSDAKVCHQSKMAVVDFDPAAVTGEKVLATIQASGYKATEATN